MWEIWNANERPFKLCARIVILPDNVDYQNLRGSTQVSVESSSYWNFMVKKKALFKRNGQWLSTEEAADVIPVKMVFFANVDAFFAPHVYLHNTKGSWKRIGQ